MLCINGRSFERRAWTGGTTPTKDDKQSPAFKSVRSYFFREQVALCGGLGLWECAGTSPLERARIFWNRATLDAWRTISR